MCVNVEPGMRTAAAVARKAAAKISLHVLALSLIDTGCCSSVYYSTTGCCSTTCCCCCCCCGLCSSKRRWLSTGSHPTESWVEQNCMSSGYWLCVSYGPKTAVPRNPDEKKTKTQLDVKKSRQRMHMHLLVRDNTWAGPSNTRAGPRNCRAGPRLLKK